MRDCSGHHDDPAAWIRQTSPLLIVGGSVRAAIHSARRSGWQQLIAVDLYQDCDLPPNCRGQQVGTLDHRLASLPVIRAAEGWMYTGSLENRPQLVAQISRQAVLLGNPDTVLRGVRDPQAVAAALQAANLPFAEVMLQPDSRLERGRWLCKPLASGAGRGIRFVGGSDPRDAPSSCYYQRYVRGQPCAGAFVAAAGSARLLGVTRQLIGQSSLGGRAFQYAGSIGPLELTTSQQQQWQHLGDCMSSSFGLRGLFGVDAIDTGEAIVPVEVNPRYTASIEVLERSLRWPIVAWHVQACRAARLPELRSPTSIGCSGKAIVYAVKRCRWTGQSATLHAAGEAEDAWPPWADIPPQDSCFEPGWPVLTALAEGSGLPDVQARLCEQVAQVRSDWLPFL